TAVSVAFGTKSQPQTRLYVDERNACG
ncbi:peptidase M16 inactive domain protein, partial [Vibrio parahaemolyticus V-223/04]